MSNESDYRAATTSRLVARCPEQVLVGQSEYFQGINVAVDNLVERALPPFVPFFRCSDNLFGKMLRHLHAEARVCYLPIGVWHSPEPARSHAPEEIWRSGTALRFYDFMEAVLGLWGAHQELWGIGTDGFVGFGRRLCSLPLPRLHRLVFEALASRAAFRIHELRALLSRHGRQPQYWARDADRFIAMQLQWLSDAGLRFCEHGLGGGLTSARDHLSTYLDVVEAWPTLRAAAASMDFPAGAD